MILQYPVITAYEPYSEDRFRQNYQSRHLVTTATNQALLQPENRKRLLSRSRSSRSEASSSSGKGKAKAKGNEGGEEEESQGLLSKVENIADRLQRTTSSSSRSSRSSHFSDRSGIVDLVVEDTEAEEIERVRARKEGGPGWNEQDAKIFVSKYPPEEEGHVERSGFEEDNLPTPANKGQHSTTTPRANTSRTNSNDRFIVAEEDEEENSPVDNRKVRYGSLAQDDNPWGR